MTDRGRVSQLRVLERIRILFPPPHYPLLTGNKRFGEIRARQRTQGWLAL